MRVPTILTALVLSGAGAGAAAAEFGAQDGHSVGGRDPLPSAIHLQRTLVALDSGAERARAVPGRYVLSYETFQTAYYRLARPGHSGRLEAGAPGLCVDKDSLDIKGVYERLGDCGSGTKLASAPAGRFERP